MSAKDEQFATFNNCIANGIDRLHELTIVTTKYRTFKIIITVVLSLENLPNINTTLEVHHQELKTAYVMIDGGAV